MINYGLLYEFYWLQSVPLVTSLGELATISGKSQMIRLYILLLGYFGMLSGISGAFRDKRNREDGP